MKLGVPLGVFSVTACLFGLWSWLTAPEISIKSHDPKVEFIEAKWHPYGFQGRLTILQISGLNCGDKR